MNGAHEIGTGYRERLLAEAVRHLECDGAEPIIDEDAEAAARSAGGPLEARLIERARRLPQARALRAALAAVHRIAWIAALAGVVLGALAGAAAARTALGDAGEVNFFWGLLGLLGVQLLLLAVWALLFLVRPAALASGSIGGMLFTLGQAAAIRVHRGREQIAAVRAVGSVWARSPVGRWTVGSLSHAVWVAFNVGCGGMLIVLLSTRQYVFVWETTILSERTFVPLTEIIAAMPDSLGFPVPSRVQIEASRRHAGDDAGAATRGTGDGGAASAVAGGTTSEAWAGLLLGSIVLYGFGPRALLCGLCLSLRRHARASYRLDLDQPGFERLEERLRPGRRSLGIVDADDSPHRLAPPVAGARGGGAAASSGPPAIIGFELAPQPTSWPPRGADMPGAAFIDLGFADDRVSRERALRAWRESRGRAGSAVVVCALTTTPDRGVRRFIEELRSGEARPVGLVLSGGQALRARTSMDLVGQRIEDWRRMAAEAGVPAERVIEIDLERATDQSLRRLSLWAAGAGSVAAPVAGTGRLGSAFDLIVEFAAGAGPRGTAEQIELHRRIGGLYRTERDAWRAMLAAPAEVTGDLVAAVRRSADRVTGLLPGRLRLRPRWMAAGALAGGLGCVAAAALVSPVAIGALPIWSGIGAALATLLAREGDSADAGTGTDDTDAIRAAALFAMLLELQGRGEAMIGRVLDRAIPDEAEDAPLGGAQEVRRFLDETKHRFDLALARETAA